MVKRKKKKLYDRFCKCSVMSIVDLALLHVRQIGRQPKILTDTILAGFQELI